MNILKFEEKVERADAIFVGKVLSENKLKKPFVVTDYHADAFAKIKVLRVFKGDVGKLTNIYYKLPKPKKSYSSCSSVEISYAGEDKSGSQILFYVTKENGRFVNVPVMYGGPVLPGSADKEIRKLDEIYDSGGLPPPNDPKK